MGYRRSALKSTWLSARHVGRVGRYGPISSVWEASVRCDPGARIEVETWLGLGHFVLQARSQQTLIRLYRDATLSVAGSATLGAGTQIQVGPGCRLDLGDHVSFTGNTHVLVSEGVEIGSYSAISFGVLIMDSDYHQVRVQGRPAGPRQSPVRIGDSVLIGAGAKVLKGVTIGNGAVVAAGAVVTHDVPAATMVGGVPARPITEGVAWR